MAGPSARGHAVEDQPGIADRARLVPSGFEQGSLAVPNSAGGWRGRGRAAH
jgi:hypothetical protein